MELHRRLLERDPTATAELAQAVYPGLVRRLSREFEAQKDWMLPHDAATEAFMAYVKKPDRFDPTKRSLPGYLLMAARRDLLNMIASERRRGSKVIAVGDVELGARAGNEIMKPMKPAADDPVDRAISEEARRAIEELFDDPKDRDLMQLVVDGERSTRRFAEVLGVGDRPAAEQRRLVKRHKDRIKKRLQRFGEALGGRRE